MRVLAVMLHLLRGICEVVPQKPTDLQFLWWVSFIELVDLYTYLGATPGVWCFSPLRWAPKSHCTFDIFKKKPLGKLRTWPYNCLEQKRFLSRWMEERPLALLSSRWGGCKLKTRLLLLSLLVVPSFVWSPADEKSKTGYGRLGDFRGPSNIQKFHCVTAPLIGSRPA